jgi:exopolysaccharide biosynthesis polyprenyl glycosylphosphotransferase
MVASTKSTTLWNNVLVSRRLWSAWHWRCMLVGGDTFFLLCALSHAFFALSVVDINVHRDWLTWALWMAVGSLSWLEGVRLTKPYTQRYTFCYRQGVMSIYCAIGMMACCWSIFFLTFFRRDFTQYTYIMVPFVLVFVLLISIWRIIYYFALKLFRFRPQIVVIGHSRVTDAVMHDVCHFGQPAPTVLGYISKCMPTNLLAMSWPYLGERKALQNLIHHGLVDMVVISDDDSLESGMYQEIFQATTCGIGVIALSELYEHTLGRVSLLYEDGYRSNMLLLGRIIPFAYRSWCRVLDICFCLCGGFVLILLLPLLATLIYLDSPGPIFYWQERVGYRGRSFRLLKFRSMHIGAEGYGAVWTRHRDARVTRVGRVMRAMHLDELPQVINILRGEMSLIGPRPERQLFVSQLEQVIPLFSYRLNVKPGLTGWAQVKMPYASTYQDAIIKLQHDLYYIKHRSFLLDINILFKTCIEMLWCSGR